MAPLSSTTGRGARFGDWLWRRLPSVRRTERERFRFFAGLYALLTLGQTLGLAGSESLFLERLGAEGLPWAFVLAAALSVAASLLYAAAVGRARNDRLFEALLVAAAAAIAVAALGLGRDDRTLRVGLFCAFYATQVVFLTHYRTFAADFFDTLSSKRLLPSFAVGASVGGALGGLCAVGLEALAGPESLVWGWSVALLATAGWLFAGRRSLPRWSLAGAEGELDESSVEGLRGAVRFLSRSVLARWLVVSVVGMVFALSLLQFLSSEIFVAELGDARSMARFFGAYLAISNVLEIAVVLWVTPRLIERLGVASANLAHPFLTLGAFSGLAIAPGMAAAVAARASREMLENALAGEVRNLSYNSLPFRFRGSLRALLEGMVFYAAMSIAGLALLLAGPHAERTWLVVLGLAAATLYIAANGRVRTAYLRSLIAGLREGRLDLDQVRTGLEGGQAARVAEQWERMAVEEAHASRVTLELPELLAQREIFAPVLRTALRAHPQVRVACLDALAPRLADLPEAQVAEVLATGLSSDVSEVRGAAARAARALHAPPEAVRRALEGRLADEDEEVRAEAACALGAGGHPTLRAMAESDHQPSARAALDRLPPELVEVALRRLDDPEPALRAAALRCAVRAPDRLDVGWLEAELERPEPEVRAAAVEAAAWRAGSGGLMLLARALDDQALRVRTAAAAGLARLGAPGVEAAERALAAGRLWTADAALSALASAESGPATDALRRAFQDSVRRAWRAYVAHHVSPTGDSLPLRFMRAALGDAGIRAQQIALRALERLEDPRVVRSVRESLRSGAARERADALEVLSNLGARESSQLLALLLETSPLEEKLEAAARSLRLPAGAAAALEMVRNDPDRWLQLAYACHAAETDSPGGEGLAEELRTMERLLALRNVSLFAHLTLDQLDAVASFLEEHQYLSGELIVREGETGEHLFVLLEGEVQAVKGRGTPGETLLNVMRPPSYFGEIAILDRAPRSASVVATADCRVLRLGGERFKELILQAPEIAFEVFRVLTARLRAADERSAPRREALEPPA
ncbi:MAG: cyclic nucleotide-binding domain-containing protein [Myxococcota bacterium]